MMNDCFDFSPIQKLIDSGRHEEALRKCLEFVEDRPEQFGGYFGVAKVLAQTKKYAEAVEYADLAIQRNKEEPALFFSRGLWRLEVGAVSAARDDFSTVLQLSKKARREYYVESAHFFRAIANSMLSDWEGVLRDCSRVRDDFQLFALGSLFRREDLQGAAKRRGS